MDLKKRQFLSAQVDLSKFNGKNFDKATDEEKKQQDVMGESTTFFKDGMKRLRKNPLASSSIFVLVLIILTIMIALLSITLINKFLFPNIFHENFKYLLLFIC